MVLVQTLQLQKWRYFVGNEVSQYHELEEAGGKWAIQENIQMGRRGHNFFFGKTLGIFRFVT